MKTFREHIDEAFFVITSENIATIKSGRIYGYCIYNNKFIKDCNLTEDINITSESLGLFVAIKKVSGGFCIVQDCTSFIQLYFFQQDGYWAISNSFWCLIDEIKKNFHLTLNCTYVEQFFSSGVSPLTLSNTLSNEIKLVPACSDIYIDEKSYSLQIVQNKQLINKIPINTKKAVDLIDSWASKWISIIRSIYNAGFQIKIDLSGGFDTRVSFALVAASGIDLNSKKVTVYTRAPSSVFGNEDYNIATAIANHFGFSLSTNYNVTTASCHINAEDTYEIYYRILSNCHREPYMPRVYYEKPVFYLNGLGAEIIRGWKNRDDFLSFFKNPAGKASCNYFPVIAQKEILICNDFCQEKN